jgi:hypothetical protein
MSSSGREVLLWQARHCDERSPLYARICRDLLHEPFVNSIIDEWTWETPLRLLSGIHYLVLAEEADWTDISAVLRKYRDFLRDFVANQPIQTNEVQRSWFLAPCFAAVANEFEADEIDIIELGASAGLNLLWDAYRYRYRQGNIGPEDAPLELEGEERRDVPSSLLARIPRVRSRVGIDNRPVDICSDEGLRLLRAFVWPDQRWRLELLDRAAKHARLRPAPVLKADFVEALPGLLHTRSRKTPTVVFETAALGYLERERAFELLRALDTAGDQGNLAMVSARDTAMGGRSCYSLTLTIWPPGERRILCEADLHGAWLDWLER